MVRKVVCKLEDVKNSLSLLNPDICSFDTETTSLVYTEQKLTGISLSDGNTTLYIPIGLGGDDKTKISIVGNYLLNCKRLVAHNWVFDAAVFYKYGIDLSGIKRFDTMIAHHLIDENDRHGLKHLVRTVLNKEVSDFDSKLSHYDKRFYEYALDDSINTWLLYKEFLPIIQNETFKNLFFNIEMPFQNVLLEMKVEGVLIDQKKLLVQRKKLQSEILRLQTELYDILGERYTIQMSIAGDSSTVVSNLNLNSGQQLAEIIYKRLGLEVKEWTKGGSPGTGVEALKHHKEHPFIQALLKYKIASKLYNAFISERGQIQRNLEIDGKVRTDFKDTGAKTGRLSSSNPNIQQLPKPKEYSPVKARELFIAPAGYKMFSCDYSGQEVAVAAQISKDPTLVKSLRNGYDMHLAVARQFYNLDIPEECLSKENEDYDSYKEKYKDSRSKAKTITFGLLYGKEAYGFSKDFGITEDEAQKIVDDYFSGMPVLKQSIEDSHKELTENGFVTILSGRKRRFIKNEKFGNYDRSSYRECYNSKVQGFSADMIRAAMVNAYHRKKNKEHLGLKTVMTVHDEAVYICKEEHVEEATTLVKKAFEDVCKKFVVPVRADVDVGENYGNAK